jgi:hypothetical protein
MHSYEELGTQGRKLTFAIKKIKICKIGLNTRMRIFPYTTPSGKITSPTPLLVGPMGEISEHRLLQESG